MSAAVLRAPVADGAASVLRSGDRSGDGLLRQFEAFYAEVVRVRSALALGSGLIGRREGLGPSEVAGIVHRRLRGMLEAQALAARDSGGPYAEALYREAQYVMAALADETFLLRVDWGGRDAWQDCLLETALFGTRVAGERVFERLDALLADSAHAHPSLAVIYLVALALGFRGRYWQPQDAGQVRSYRLALATIIARQVPDIEAEPSRLFAQAYRHTIEQGRAVRLPYLRPWLAALAVVAVIFLVGTHGLWLSATADLSGQLTRIEHTASASTHSSTE